MASKEKWRFAAGFAQEIIFSIFLRVSSRHRKVIWVFAVVTLFLELHCMIVMRKNAVWRTTDRFRRRAVARLIEMTF